MFIITTRKWYKLIMVYVFCLDGIKAWALKDIGFVSISYSVSDFYSVPSPNLVLLVIHQRSNQSTCSKIVCKNIHKKVSPLPSLKSGEYTLAKSVILENLYLVFSFWFLVQTNVMYIIPPPTSLPFKNKYTFKTMVHSVADENLSSAHI